jgi:hypothetical protein
MKEFQIIYAQQSCLHSKQKEQLIHPHTQEQSIEPSPPPEPKPSHTQEPQAVPDAGCKIEELSKDLEPFKGKVKMWLAEFDACKARYDAFTITDKTTFAQMFSACSNGKDEQGVALLAEIFGLISATCCVQSAQYGDSCYEIIKRDEKKPDVTASLSALIATIPHLQRTKEVHFMFAKEFVRSISKTGFHSAFDEEGIILAVDTSELNTPGRKKPYGSYEEKIERRQHLKHVQKVRDGVYVGINEKQNLCMVFI